jgi:hypothetical protein
MENGNLVEYMEANPDADRLVLVIILSTDLQTNPNLSNFFQLSDVADGLFYLHGIGLVHGDLKGVCTYSMSDKEQELIISGKYLDQQRLSSMPCRFWADDNNIRFLYNLLNHDNRSWWHSTMDGSGAFVTRRSWV